MKTIIDTWCKRHLSNPQAVALLIISLLACLAIGLFNRILCPVFWTFGIAYLIQWLVTWLKQFGLNHTTAVSIAMVGTILVGLLLVCYLVPIIISQINSLIEHLPILFDQGRQHWTELALRYPGLIKPNTINNLSLYAQQRLAVWGQWLFTTSYLHLIGLFSFFIYLLLVPLMVFYLLKDQREWLGYWLEFLPEPHDQLHLIVQEVHRQLGRYLLGKLAECAIVGIMTYVVFAYFDIRYGLLMSVLVALSVFVPYIGIVIASVPVVGFAVAQFGLGNQALACILAYLVVQVIDGNLIVPLLFSRACHMNPLTILISVLFFGGLFGFWGMFFALPITILLRAMLQFWPSQAEFIESRQGNL